MNARWPNVPGGAERHAMFMIYDRITRAALNLADPYVYGSGDCQTDVRGSQ